MKKLLPISILSILLILQFSVLTFADNSYYPEAGKKTAAANSDTSSAPLYGSFSVPSAGISINLYNSYQQSVCDARNSACFYHLSANLGMTIVDHNYQEFRNLINVTAGATATISLNNGGKIYIQCVEVYDGRNETSCLTDNYGNIATGTHDYLTYTCLDNNGAIRICQWDIVNATGIDPTYDNAFNIDSRTKARIATYAAAPTPDPTPAPGKGKGNNKKK